MQSNASASALGLGALIRLPLREARLFWEFTWRDWSTTIIPTAIFALAALKTRWPVSMNAAALSLGRCLVYFALYIYTFCLANQIAGVEEDSVNKPDRPIPRGLVSHRGALVRWTALTAVFLAVGAWFGVFVWALAWAILTVLVCFCGWDRHWFTKNVVVMTLGVLVELAATWELVTPLTPSGWRWVLVLSGTIGVTSILQDMRDEAGDRAVGRRTLPVAIGENATRWAMATLFALAPIAVHVGLMSGDGGAKVLACDVALGAWSLAIAARILGDRSPRAAHATYMFYTYWYCALLVSAVVVL
jgi:4-hydroxybenzoate polyprenyltransferase